jgi:hypothetical protein
MSDADTNDVAAIVAGREAWSRIHQATTFECDISRPRFAAQSQYIFGAKRPVVGRAEAPSRAAIGTLDAIGRLNKPP